MDFLKRFVCFFAAALIFIFSCSSSLSFADDVDLDQLKDLGFSPWIDGIDYPDECYDVYRRYLKDDSFKHPYGSSSGSVYSDISDISGFIVTGLSSYYLFIFPNDRFNFVSDGDIFTITAVDGDTSFDQYRFTSSGSTYSYGAAFYGADISGSGIGYSDTKKHLGPVYYNISTLNAAEKIYIGGGTLDLSGDGVCLYPFGAAFDTQQHSLDFFVSPGFAADMSMAALPDNFTVTVDNSTASYYNYIIYISTEPASLGIVRSMSTAAYILSSKQWCMKYINSSEAADSSFAGSIADWYKNSFGNNVFDTWGDAIDIGKTYYDNKNNGINYYVKSQQNDCPFYLIKPMDNRNHIIPYSSLGLQLNQQYYFNIIYYCTDNYGVVPSSSNVFDDGSSIHNQYRDMPIYNTGLLSSFGVYCSELFTFGDGVFNASPSSFSSIIKNGGLAAGTATMGSDDDVTVNDSHNYDGSVHTSYVNYGTIYHGCTINGSFGGASGGGVPGAPDPPYYDFSDLTDKAGNFFDFVREIFEAMGFIPVTIITATIVVCVYCRIVGR